MIDIKIQPTENIINITLNPSPHVDGFTFHLTNEVQRNIIIRPIIDINDKFFMYCILYISCKVCSSGVFFRIFNHRISHCTITNSTTAIFSITRTHIRIKNF